MNRRVLAVRRQWSSHSLRAGGALMVLGSVLPWVYLPLAGVRLPVPGLLGWGALTLLLGVWLLRRPVWWTGLPACFVGGLVAWKAWSVMPATVMGGILLLEGRVQPLNDLLSRFALPPVSLFELGLPWSQIRGPGPATVAVGAFFALTGAAVTALSSRDLRSLERCASCGHRHRPGRITAFCVRCGDAMPCERACPECHTLAEPGDACCGVCGSQLARLLS